MRFKEWAEARDMSGVVEAVVLSREGLEKRFLMVDFLRAKKKFMMCDHEE